MEDGGLPVFIGSLIGAVIKIGIVVAFSMIILAFIFA